MKTFRILLVVVFLVDLVYILRVATGDGAGSLAAFTSDIADFSWRGQFNVDFSNYLLLSALWVAWRHRFTAKGIGLSLLCALGGALVFIPYLLIASFQHDGSLGQLVSARPVHEIEAGR